MTILIAGGGVAGLTLGLTLHQIGAPFRIYEAVRTMRPLGVGINLQPHAVRELFDLGLEDGLDQIGVRTREYGFYTKFGKEIWVEPRGIGAGYAWPQFSIHRGELQMLLHRTLIARAGPDVFVSGARAAGFAEADGQAILRLDGGAEAAGALVIGADGVHSAIRAQMQPGEGDPIWNGAVMWRGVAQAPAFRGGGSMALCGHDWERVVAYPLSEPDPETGLCTMNWIVERRFDAAQGWSKEDWTRQIEKSEILPTFADWRFGWLDAPDLINGAEAIFEYPMVDREPLDRWTEGRATLMGDAAHITYPVGSNGASQAIVDARVLGRKLIDHGIGPEALAAYEAQMRPIGNGIVRANRGSGPDAVMQWVEDRCGGVFDHIDDVIPRAELAAHAAKYKKISGMAIEELNALPPTIPKGARLEAFAG